ncbi:MAG: amidase [Candidatus Bathyarchaeia archaeon]
MPPSPIFMSISELSEQIRNRQFSSVELTELFLGRLETIGPIYNAVITITRTRALKQARKADREIASGRFRGPLHGIPYGAKDLFATSGGTPTTWGAEPFRNQTFDYDATVIKKLEKAGAVLAAKLAMIELAGGMGYRQPNACFTGPPRNPWNPNTWAGGSSSGSAIAVCAGLLPFTIGSETWGSILRPANNCGITGLRPTYGRVSRFGAMALSWTLDKIGPFALTAEDCGLILEAIAGPDKKDPTTFPKAYKFMRITPRPLKLAIPAGVTEGLDHAICKNFKNSLSILNKVATVDEVEFPKFPFEAITRTILYAESASIFDEFIDEGGLSKLTAPEDRYTAYARTAILAKDYLRAMRLRNLMIKAMEETLTPYDAVVAPTCRTVATPITQPFRDLGGRTFGDIVGAIGNTAGLPSISVPNGFTPNGLPTGIQFMGKPYDENAILTIAYEYQSLTDWHKHHPPALA